ncbi:hypothetical protein ACOTTU_24520 [Roseobacter sp. EG26]|uniref:hypothetical protein n=1 Tax=Roseobacter sp. EG26 TaxID=3412477 RepID=UPI003CE532E9
MLSLLKKNLFDTIAVLFTIVAAAWLIYTFFLEDIWSAKHVNLDIAVLDSGETVIGGSAHYFLTYRVSSENKSSRQMSFIFARTQLSLHTADLQRSISKDSFRITPSNEAVHQYTFDHLWSAGSATKHAAFSFPRYRLDANESVSEVITAAFPKSENADYVSIYTRGLIYPTCRRNWLLAKKCNVLSSEVAAVETGDCPGRTANDEFEVCNKYFIENSDGTREEISFEVATRKFRLSSTRHNQVLPFSALLTR